MPQRSTSSGSYRYGFNGQEKSDEIKGSGNSYTAAFWEYDPRLGRRWNRDPIYKNSPYEAFGGNPIIYADPMGLDTISFNKHTTIVTPSNSGFSGGGMKATVKSTFSINVKQAPGEDVFMSVNTSTTINGDGSVSHGRPQTKILDPYSNQASGVTKGQNLYFDGILTTVRDNKDWESVGKFMNLDRGFYDYMINRHSASAGWRSKALSIEAMEGVLPVLVSSGLGSYAGFRYAAAAKSSTDLTLQIHHFATNKHSFYTKQMSEIADEFGLSLDGAWNKQALPHLGRHPNAYHNFVLNGMQNAKSRAGGSQAEFLNLFNKYVKQPVIQNPGLLRKSGW